MEIHDAQNLAYRLMDEHGLTVDGWTLTLDNAKRRLGVCRYGRREIGLSAPIVALNDVSVIHDTILHEIAHALAGHAAGHGPRWKSVAREIGARPDRCADASEVVAPAARWKGLCRVCGFEVPRHRLTASARRAACPDCCNKHNRGRFSEAYVLTWQENRVA